MKIAEIDWELFWYAWSQQESADLDCWLGRWVFADDRVRLSMQPALSESENSAPINALAGKISSTKILASGMHARQSGSAGQKSETGARSIRISLSSDEIPFRLA